MVFPPGETGHRRLFFANPTMRHAAGGGNTAQPGVEIKLGLK
jgi:hypothetical protein